jgi:RNA polymerase sigma-70 factor (ECF subfamily)
VISRRIDDYVARPDVSLYVWMRQLTLQTLIDVQRRHFGQKRSPNQEVAIGLGQRDQTSLSIADAICAQWSSPSRAAIREEEVQQLRQALASMDEIDREVLALRHFEHLTNTEVAETLGLTATAASNRYVRAMTRLTELMQRLAGDS